MSLNFRENGSGAGICTRPGIVVDTFHILILKNSIPHNTARSYYYLHFADGGSENRMARGFAETSLTRRGALEFRPVDLDICPRLFIIPRRLSNAMTGAIYDHHTTASIFSVIINSYRCGKSKYERPHVSARGIRHKQASGSETRTHSACACFFLSSHHHLCRFDCFTDVKVCCRCYDHHHLQVRKPTSGGMMLRPSASAKGSVCPRQTCSSSFLRLC